MDIPLHLAAAACAGNLMAHIYHRKRSFRALSRKQGVICGAGAFGLGIATHLLLDAAPHYTFVYGILKMTTSPFLLRHSWAFSKIVLLSLPVLLILRRCSKQQQVFLTLAMFGGIYPDVEKYTYLRHILPRMFVLFPWHSYSYSPNGWETQYKLQFMLGETCLYGLFLWGFAWMVNEHNRAEKRPFKGFLVSET